jgi:hypothetical protein
MKLTVQYPLPQRYAQCPNYLRESIQLTELIEFASRSVFTSLLNCLTAQSIIIDFRALKIMMRNVMHCIMTLFVNFLQSGLHDYHDRGVSRQARTKPSLKTQIATYLQ